MIILGVCKKNPLHFWFLLKQRHGFDKMSDQQKGAELLNIIGMNMDNDQKFIDFHWRQDKLAKRIDLNPSLVHLD